MKIEIGESFKTPFANEAGVYQDGTVPLYRDVDGRLWGMSGHSHMGHIGMFCGTTLKDMRYVYEAKTNFEVGTAGTAFAGIKYPGRSVGARKHMAVRLVHLPRYA